MTRGDDPASWLLNTVDRANRSYGWTRPKVAALAALVGVVAWLATFVTLALTAGLLGIPTLACTAVGAVAITADYIAGRRATAYQRDTKEIPMDWYCPECCASSSSGGTCAACDITLVKGDPDGGR